MENFVYIIGDEKTREAAVVDPGWAAHSIVSVCADERLRVTKVILTHEHFDHTREVPEIVSFTEAQVYAHSANRYKNNGLEILRLRDNDTVSVGDVKFQVIHTPGHSPGSVSYLVDGKKLLTGDTLFVDGVGRTDFRGGSKDELGKSLLRIAALGDDIEVWPGHDYGSEKSSTIGKLKETNQAFRSYLN